MRMPLLFFVMSCVMFGAWSATDVSRSWMRRLKTTFAQFELTPKVLRIEMDLTEKQIYDQLGLVQPMHAARLEEVWANHPDAYDAYCIDHLESRGYRVFRESRLADALDVILNERKPMAKAALPDLVIEKAS